jgi:PAS domain S-box-containing protein
MTETAQRLRALWTILAVAMAYFVTAELGLTFALQPANVTPVWIPAGIAVASAILFGRYTIIGAFLGEIAVATTININIQTALVMSTGNTLEVLLCAHLTKQMLDEHLQLSRVRSVAGFFGATILSSFIAATVGTLALNAGGYATQSLVQTTWITWLLGDITGIIIITPILLSWLQKPKFSVEIPPNWQELLLYYTLLLLTNLTVFNGWLAEYVTNNTSYVLLVFAIWAAFRFDQREASRTTLIIAAFAVWAAFHRSGPFTGTTLNPALLSLQVFLSILSTVGLMLSIVVNRQRTTEQALRLMSNELEQRVQERTAELQRSEERYRLLTELSPNGIMIHKGGIVQLANAAALNMMGAESIEQVVGKSILDFVMPESRSMVIERMSLLASGQSVPKIEERFRRMDGTPIDVEVVGLPFMYDGEPAAQVVFTDISERKAAEQKVRESEAKYKAIVSNSPDIIMQIRLSDYVLEFVHFPGEPTFSSFVGDNVFRLMPPDFRDPLKQALDELVVSRTTLLYETSGEVPSRGFRYFASYIAPLFDAENQLYAAYLVTRDVTERKAAEQSLLHERDLYEALVNSLPGIFYLFDEEGKFLRWNRNFETVSGYTADEIRSLKPENFFSVADSSILHAMIAEVFRGGRLEVDAKIITKHGEQIAHYFTGSVIRIEDKRCIIGVGIDISERKKTEAQLKKSEARLRDAQRVAKVGSYELDLRTNTFEASEALYTILGMDTISTEHQTLEAFFKIVHPDDAAQIQELLNTAIHSGKEFSWDFRVVRPSDQQVLWVNGTGKIAHDKNHLPTRFRGTIQDITARKTAEEAVKRYNEELEERVRQRTLELAISMEKERRFNQAKTEFVIMLSHQFRTPMTIILSASEILTRILRKTLDPVPPLVERHLTNIGSQVKVMSDMLAAVSRLMNIQTNILSELPIQITIQQFCEQTLREFQMRFPGDSPRAITLDNQAGALTVHVQYTVLQTALLELLRNADQFSPKESPVTFRVTLGNGMLTFAIEDYGKGIAPEEHEMIFELFQRGTEERETGHSRGLGLGLTVAKMCVEALNGRVWCKSALGKGSVFSVELPLSLLSVETLTALTPATHDAEQRSTAHKLYEEETPQR